MTAHPLHRQPQQRGRCPVADRRATGGVELRPGLATWVWPSIRPGSAVKSRQFDASDVAAVSQLAAAVASRHI